VNDFELLGSRLFEAHGTLIGIVGGSGHRVVDSELARAGQQGFGFAGTSDTEMRGTTITESNLDGFDPQWEAGAGKASRVRGLTLSDNSVVDNAGPGLWCDIDCESVTMTGNRIDGNEGPGILYEISSDAAIADNLVTDNGWGNADWGWGGGILVSSSARVDVASNTLAWNADGVTVISQGRSDRPTGAGTMITVHDNVVLAAPQPSDRDGVYLEAWLQDWPGPLFAPGSGNRGSNDRFWSTQQESSKPRFAWAGDLASLQAYGSTPGGSGSRYLAVADKDAVLLAAGLEPEANPHEVTASLRARLLGLVVPILIGGLLIVAIAGLLVARRRLARRPGVAGPG
jgi:parallel beta-helix repeat protein